MTSQLSAFLVAALAMAAVPAAAQSPAAAPAEAQNSNDTLPDGPAKAVILRACSSCHQPSVIASKRRSAQEWDDTIGKMVGLGAQLTDAEQDQVYSYLVQNFGENAANSAPATGPQGPAGH